MIHRKGMKIFRMESEWQTIEGDANELEALGFDSSMVRYAVSNGRPYKGYICTQIGVREKGVNEVSAPKKVTVEDFNNLAISQGKTYAELQLEETMGRRVIC